MNLQFADGLAAESVAKQITSLLPIGNNRLLPGAYTQLPTAASQNVAQIILISDTSGRMKSLKVKSTSFHVATVPKDESASNLKSAGHAIAGAVRSFILTGIYDINKYQINFVAKRKGLGWVGWKNKSQQTKQRVRGEKLGFCLYVPLTILCTISLISTCDAVWLTRVDYHQTLLIKINHFSSKMFFFFPGAPPQPPPP